jgi:hypothetical protein
MVPEKSARGKSLGNFARAASFSKAFTSKSKNKNASRSATAPKGAIPAEVAKAQAAAAAATAVVTEVVVTPPRVNEPAPAKAPAGTAAAPASVLAGQKKRTGSFGGRKTPPRRSHCSNSSTEGGRQLVNADGKPTENTPRCGDFEEYESGSSDDFSEDEGPAPGQAIASAAFDDISGRLSGGDFVFSL